VIDTGAPLPHHGAVTETVASAPTATRTRRRRRARRAAVAVVLLALVALEVRSVLWFSSVLPWSVGERVHVCGRDFERAGHVGAAEAQTDVTGVPWQRIADGPLFQPLYGFPAAGSYRALGAPCTMELFLPEDDGYRAYVLVGGP
jgi:hypothetical protein